jgi:hypothetical protein
VEEAILFESILKRISVRHRSYTIIKSRITIYEGEHTIYVECVALVVRERFYIKDLKSRS